MKTIKIFIALSVLAIFSQCTKDFDDLNVNPNEPTTANVNYLFTESILRGTGGYGTGVHTEMWSLEVWCQFMADINGINNPGEFYPYSGDWNNELWRELYAEALSPVNQIVKITDNQTGLVNKNAIARIWRAYLFQRITDLWGDIPYFDALKGVNEDGSPIMTPKYDDQKTIYLDLIDELKTAVSLMDPAKQSFDGADPFYQGDLSKWKRFANTLRLRMLLRISDKETTFAETEIKALMLENEFISANHEGAHLHYSTDYKHYFYEIAVNGQGLRNPSWYFIEMLNGSDDPRVSYYADKTPSSVVMGTDPYVGVPNMKTSVELGNLGFDAFSTSECGNYFIDISTPGTTLSYAESCFLQSEAAQKGWGSGVDAQQAYEAGIRAHMEYLGIHDSLITDYIQNHATWNNQLEQIITQKYITFAFRDAYEAYAEYRRTGYPELTDYSGGPVPNTFPNRLSYPPSELTLNGTNVQAVGEGINDTQSKVWWAK